MNQISIFSILFLITTCVEGLKHNSQSKTFPGAEVIIPGVIGSIAPVISSVIIPPVSISHSTSISAVLHQKPIALSHSGTISTSSGASTTATGSAVVQKPTLVATSSSSANQVKKLFMSLNIL